MAHDLIVIAEIWLTSCRSRLDLAWFETWADDRCWRINPSAPIS